MDKGFPVISAFGRVLKATHNCTFRTLLFDCFLFPWRFHAKACCVQSKGHAGRHVHVLIWHACVLCWAAYLCLILKVISCLFFYFSLELQDSVLFSRCRESVETWVRVMAIVGQLWFAKPDARIKTDSNPPPPHHKAMNRPWKVQSSFLL